VDFDWDPLKAKANLQKHGVSFSEAMTVFGDWLSGTVYDAKHSDIEDRYLTIGTSVEGNLLIVAHTYRGNIIRIISARGAPRRERISDQVPPEDDLEPEYDFRSMGKVERGKFAKQYHERLRVIRLAEDVAPAFADEAAVNEALREYLRGTEHAK
jgi:hypothetical protein